MAKYSEVGIIKGSGSAAIDLSGSNPTIGGSNIAVASDLTGKQNTMSGGDGIALDGVTIDVDLEETILVSERLVLSGMTDSDHNGTYDLVYRSGSRMQARASQSGANLEIDIEREAPYSIDISGTGLAAADGQTVVVLKHTGYLSKSGDTFTWSTGSTGGTFHWYYWDSANEIFAAYQTTDDVWEVYDLSQGTGNVASFISDLNSTGSTGGYISGGENFTLTSGNLATLTASSTAYPSEIVVVPAAGGNVTYGAVADHPYFVYQNAEATKWLIYSDTNYWTGWHRAAAFDLATESLTDDATAFVLDDTSDFEYITTSSDTLDGVNIPDAASSKVTYTAAQTGSFLEIAGSKLKAKVVDMSGSDTSALVSQADAKTYIDTQVATKQDSFAFGDGLDESGGTASVDLSATPFLEFSTGQLQAIALDEDDMNSDSATSLATQQSIKAYVDGQTGDVAGEVETLAGVGTGATNLGTFTGTTITDNSSVKTALQELETSVELKAADADVLKKDGSVALTANWDLSGGSQYIKLPTPAVGADAATKSYVDASTSGQGAFWTPVSVLSMSNITLSGEQTLDGVLTSTSRVLVQGQTDASENGIYVSAAGAWSRATDADADGEFKQNKTVAISDGDTCSGCVYAFTGSDDPVVGTDDLTFTLKQTASSIADGSITAVKLAADAVVEAKIATGAVTLGKIGADAVDGDKIADDSIGSEHIAAGAVDTTALGADAVDGTKIADDAIDSEHLAAGAVDNAAVATGIAASKLGVDTLADAVVAEANVTQHEAALTIAKSQLTGVSAMVEFFHGTLTHDGGATQTLKASLPSGYQCLRVKCYVDTAFDGTTPTVEIGVSGDQDALCDTTALDLTDAAAGNNPQVVEIWFDNTSAQNIEMYLSVSGASAGSARVGFEAVSA